MSSCSSYLFAINGNHTGAKLDANCEIMYRLEALIGELEQETGFANA